MAGSIAVDLIAGHAIAGRIVPGDRLDATTARFVCARIDADDDLLKDLVLGRGSVVHAGERDDGMNGRRAAVHRGSSHEVPMVVSDRAVLRVDDSQILGEITAEPGCS